MGWELGGFYSGTRFGPNATVRNPRKISGAWAVIGTRVPVYALFENLESGATLQDFLEWFPEVKKWHVEAVLRHEAEYFKTPALP